VLSVEGVQDCHQIRARGTVDYIHLDLHIKLNPRTPLQDAHRISHIVQDRIREEFPQIGDIVVHVEPA
ncbi:MAG: cation transporter, partial [candidate division Zixibacteria bacterium]|nr:cation transporter [candidate division Zixibacteria bacterium]NIR65264.1 cation transporter [candidate division Zixibacteria bacterium]NIS47008.1 cation transporter [candidate division Zixibacteria bacterium]NIU15156.1 cation transporter [candidate division Zixibacteria bacterium]NIV07201.1 cation transporter [candidate division Zixibacteria bacterium]